MFPSPVQNFVFGATPASNDFTFVVEGQEFTIETRFLLPCNYFNSMLNSGMKESTSRRVNVDHASKNTVKVFLEFLKTFQLPNLDIGVAWKLYGLGHLYGHEGLLNLLRPQFEKNIPQLLPEILNFACIYSDAALIKACKDYAAQNTHSTTSMLYKLVDLKNEDSLKEALTWPQQTIGSMFTYAPQYGQKNAFSKLLDFEMYSMAALLLKVANGMGVRTSSIVPNAQETLLQLLNQETQPSEEQKILILALAGENPNCLISAGYNVENPPLFVVAHKGWNELFNEMLKVCKDGVLHASSKNIYLLSLAIEKRRILIIKALKDVSPKLQTHELTKYILEAIKSKYQAGLEQLLKFHVQRKDRAIITIECVEAAIETKDLKILQTIWPYFKGEKDQISRLQKRVFEEDRFDLAEIIFSGTFDSSKETYYDNNRQIPWMHFVARKGSLSWITFMAKRCTDKNITINLTYSSYGNNSPLVTPLLMALTEKREAEIILKLLSFGFDVDKGNDQYYPIHQILAYNDVVLLREFLKLNPNLSVINKDSENFFHLSGSLLTAMEFKEQVLRTDKSAFEQKTKEVGQTPLHVALSKNQFTEAFYMFMKNPDILWIANQAKVSPFQTLSGDAFGKMMNLFIDLSGDSYVNEGTRSALLFWCAENFLYHFCEKLISKVKDVESVSRNGKNLLHLAAEGGMYETVKKLIELKIPVDSTDALKKTALHLAVEKVNPKMVKLLLTLEANTQLLDINRETPLSLAIKKYQQPRSQEMREVIELLENKSCNVQ